MDEIGHAVQKYTVMPDPEATHGYFLDALTSPEFYDELTDQLDYQRLS